MTSEYLKLWWKGPRGRYHRHKFNAKKRGVEFLLTFEEWWDIWQASGKWEQRGKGRGQYVMARSGDQGAYERGNVRICPVRENLAERNRNHPISSEQASAQSKAAWALVPAEERSGMMEARRRKRSYSPHTVETRAKMRMSAKLALSKRARDERGQWASPDKAD